MRALTFLALFMALTIPVELQAQTTGRVAVGANVSMKRALAEESRGHNSVGFLWRIGHGREGWGWKYGMNWYSTQIDAPVDGALQPFGKLRVRPIYAGYGYTHIIGRTKLSANLLGGYSFNSFSMDETFTNAYRAANGGDRVETSVSNSFALKPELSLWYDITEKFGFNVSTGYLIARPEVTVISSSGRERLRISADTMSLRAGLVYSIF